MRRRPASWTPANPEDFPCLNENTNIFHPSGAWSRPTSLFWWKPVFSGRRAKASCVRFAFAPDGELLAASQPLDPNAPRHAALIARARERALCPRLLNHQANHESPASRTPDLQGCCGQLQCPPAVGKIHSRSYPVTIHHYPVTIQAMPPTYNGHKQLIHKDILLWLKLTIPLSNIILVQTIERERGIMGFLCRWVQERKGMGVLSWNRWIVG